MRDYLRRRLRETSDDGMTLVEVILTTTVLAVVVSIMATTFPSIWGASQLVLGQTTTTQQAIALTTQLNTLLDKSQSIRIDPLIDGSQTLQATVYDVNNDVWSCEAWNFNTDGEIRHTTSEEAIDTSSTVGWTKLPETIAPNLDNGTLFVRADDTVKLTAPVVSSSDSNPTQVLIQLRVIDRGQSGYVNVAQVPRIPQSPDPDLISCFD